MCAPEAAERALASVRALGSSFGKYRTASRSTRLARRVQSLCRTKMPSGDDCGSADPRALPCDEDPPLGGWVHDRCTTAPGAEADRTTILHRSVVRLLVCPVPSLRVRNFSPFEKNGLRFNLGVAWTGSVPCDCPCDRRLYCPALLSIVHDVAPQNRSRDDSRIATRAV